MPSVKKIDFGTGRVRKRHAVTQKVKRTKAKGTVMKDTFQFREFVYYMNLIIH